MSFLTTEDYRVVTCPADLEIICQSSDKIRQQAERTAMEEVAGYVRTRYDIDSAFAKTDIQRNPLLVQLTVCIALWWLGQWLPGMIGGDMSFTSAITFDFEVWSAAQQRWLEVSSVSNFETYQANRLKCRYRDEDKKIKLCHTLNGSALALPRIVAALLENNQTPEGIVVPECLRKYTGFDIID